MKHETRPKASAGFQKPVPECCRRPATLNFDLRRPSGDLRRLFSDLRRPSDDLRRPSDELRRPSDELRRPSGQLRRPSGDLRRPFDDLRRLTDDLRRLSEHLRRPKPDFRGKMAICDSFPGFNGGQKATVEAFQPVASTVGAPYL